MNIGSLVLDRLRQDQIDEADDGSLACHVEQVLDRKILRFARLIIDFLENPQVLGVAIAIINVEQFVDRLRIRHFDSGLLANGKTQIVDDLIGKGVSSDEANARIKGLDRHHAVHARQANIDFAHYVVRDFWRHLRTSLKSQKIRYPIKQGIPPDMALLYEQARYRSTEFFRRMDQIVEDRILHQVVGAAQVLDRCIPSVEHWNLSPNLSCLPLRAK